METKRCSNCGKKVWYNEELCESCFYDDAVSNTTCVASWLVCAHQWFNCFSDAMKEIERLIHEHNSK